MSDDNIYVLNAHGDVVALLDASGDVTKRYDYDAFGNQLNYLYPEDTNPFRYCGEYFDKETSTIYLRARYYNPTIGRFSTVDPIRDGLNWYAYCGNSPVVFVDPWGLIPTNEESALISKHIYDYDESDTEDNLIASFTINFTSIDMFTAFRNSSKAESWTFNDDQMSATLEF